MSAAFIVAAARSPVGRRGGGLASVHPADLAAHAICAVLERAGVDGELLDDIILGCVSQVGAQSSNIARTAALSAGLPESVPGFTLDRQCGSSQQAVHLAAQA
ncbi:MAG TPA: acetyl-CoA C-acetyltransferase, partial [Actinomycetes bacterium]|nr:acetyl-CoA C-acetyltransferase [Actinomycetes bacterium]